MLGEQKNPAPPHYETAHPHCKPQIGNLLSGRTNQAMFQSAMRRTGSRAGIEAQNKYPRKRLAMGAACYSIICDSPFEQPNNHKCKKQKERHAKKKKKNKRRETKKKNNSKKKNRVFCAKKQKSTTPVPFCDPKQPNTTSGARFWVPKFQASAAPPCPAQKPTQAKAFTARHVEWRLWLGLGGTPGFCFSLSNKNAVSSSGVC